MHVANATFAIAEAPSPNTSRSERLVDRRPTSASAGYAVAERTPSASLGVPSGSLAGAAVTGYRLHRAKQLAYVRIAGRMIYLGRANSADSHTRYRRTVAEWLATGHAPGPHVGGERAVITVADIAEAYLRWARGYYLAGDGRPSPGLGPVEAAARVLCSLYGATSAKAFGPVALRAVRQTMLGAGLCRNVVNQRTACVKRIFRWAVAEELVPAAVLQALAAVDPLKAGRSGARETLPVRPVADEHIEAVLPFLPPTLRVMVRLQRLTGMRSGELCVMRTCDVETSADVWIYRPAWHKTAHRGHARLIYLGPQAQVLLAPLLRPHTPSRHLFAPTNVSRERVAMRREQGRCPTPEHVPVLPDPQAIGSGRYVPRSYRRALRYAMDAAIRAGAMSADKRWFPHQIRHRHATAVRQSKGLETARVLLGHRSLTQTLEYAEADAATAINAARELA